MAMTVVDEGVAAAALCRGTASTGSRCWTTSAGPIPFESEKTPDGEPTSWRNWCGPAAVCTKRGRRAYGTPLISGKDSMKNDAAMEGVKISVPPTLLVSALGQIDDVQNAVTLEPLAPGDVAFLLGPTRDETGGSEFFRYLGERDGIESALGEPVAYVGNKVPRLRSEETLPLYRCLERAFAKGLVRSAATPARGGWALAFARTVMAGELGLDLDVSDCADLAELPTDVALFSESPGRFLITVRPEDVELFERQFGGTTCHRVGRVTENDRLKVRAAGTTCLDLGVRELKVVFKRTLADG